jgi:D-xylose transport system permease protein
MIKIGALKNIKINFKSYTMIIALLLIWVVFGIFSQGSFLLPQNISNLFRQMTIISFLSIGMVFVIVTGNIDLSVGSICGFISAITAALQAYILPNILPKLFPYLIDSQGIGILSTVIAIVFSLLMSIIIGMYQGFIVAYLKVPAFIVTLGGMMIFKGGVLGITSGKTIVPVESSLVWLAQGYLSKPAGWIFAVIITVIIFLTTLWNRGQKRKYKFELKPLYIDLLKSSFFSFLILLYVFIVNRYHGVQNPVILMCVVAIIFTYLSSSTKFGRYAYAIGGNAEATRLSGINIKWNIFKVMVLMGLLSGVAGIVLTGYVAAGTINGGQDYELSAIASCVIGGTSLMGGEGTIFGALIGALVMASLENGMSVMNMAPYWQYLVKGAVLIFAVYIDISNKKKS